MMAYIHDKAMVPQQSMSKLRTEQWILVTQIETNLMRNWSKHSHSLTSNTLAKNKDEKKANVYLEYKSRWLRWDTLWNSSKRNKK